MTELKFSELAAVLAVPSHIATGTKLRVTEDPVPFVPPVFIIEDAAALERCEVIFIRASAAVGKSTLARGLSAARKLSILDLAQTPVATGSLAGVLNDFRGSTPAIDAFHAGKLPIIVDALDEGRLNSGDNGLFSFIETSADLILQNRNNKVVKLIMLGRPEAVSYAELYLSDKGVVSAVLDVGFFDEKGARELVHAYATTEAKNDSLYLVHTKPADELISTYFCKIAAALGLPSADLWTNAAGRSFAGYAPVLAALGSLLPRIENFVEAQNRLNEVGTSSAWGVIESVLDAITLREQGKVVDQLVKAGVKADTASLYSRNEQSALLMQFVQRLPQTGTGHLRLSAPDTTKYLDQVQRFLPEHPFLKGSEFSNDVIASYILAIAIMNGWKIKDEGLLRRLARQPFIWRSLKSSFVSDSILDGEYLGFILSSFWSDPLTIDESVVIQDAETGGGSFVEINLRGEATNFTATTPLHFYGQMQNVSIKTVEPISLIGMGDGSAGVFSFSGTNHVVGSIMELRATELRFRSGSTWLDAEVISPLGQFGLVIQDHTEYGWSDKLSSTYPFSLYTSVLKEQEAECEDNLMRLLADCVGRSGSGTSITVFSDYSVAENDYLRGVYARHGESFRRLISCLVEYDYAQPLPIQASGSAAKVRIKMKLSFAALREAVRNADNGEHAAIIEVLRQRI